MLTHLKDLLESIEEMQVERRGPSDADIAMVKLLKTLDLRDT